MTSSDGLYSKQQQTSVTQQQQINNSMHHPPTLINDRRILLIQSVKNHPNLYKNEILQQSLLRRRQEMQSLWALVAKESGFKNAEDAKANWRFLTVQLRQHLELVMQKKQHHYMPKADNIYNEMEFFLPYLQYKANRTQCVTNLLSDDISNTIEDDHKLKDNNSEIETEIAKETQLINSNLTVTISRDVVEDFTEEAASNSNDEEQILKECFDNMLQTIHSLPRFQKQRVKHKLLNEQMAKKEKYKNIY